MWTYGRYAPENTGPVRIWDGAGNCVADCPDSPEGELTAKQICLAVNSYAPMYAALKKLDALAATALNTINKGLDK